MPDNPTDRRMPPSVIRVLLVILFIIWSNAFTAVLHLREIFRPEKLVTARFAPVLLVCVIYLLASRERRKESIEIISDNPLKIIGMGAFGIAGYNFFLFSGQSGIKPGAAALVTTLAPLFTLLFSIFILKVKVPFKRILGILIALAGMYSVVKWGGIGLRKASPVENSEIKYTLITSLAPVSWSLYTIIGKKLTESYQPLTISALSLIIGTIPFLFLADPGFFRSISMMGATHWIALGHLSLLCTIVGYWIWNTALKYLPATSVASFIYLNPPLAAMFGWLFFGEKVTLFFLIGSAVILFGLYLTQKRENQ